MESAPAIYICRECLFRYIFEIQPALIHDQDARPQCRDCQSAAPLLVKLKELAPFAWLNFWPVRPNSLQQAQEGLAFTLPGFDGVVFSLRTCG